MKTVISGAAAAFALTAAGAAQAGALEERGAYLAAIMDCAGCHTPGALTPAPDVSRPLAGNAIGFEVPGLGVFFPPNLTNDKATGLGDWSDAEIGAAITTGKTPPMGESWPRSCRGAPTRRSMKRIWAAPVAHLRSLPVVENDVPGPFGPDGPTGLPFMTIVTR